MQRVAPHITLALVAGLLSACGASVPTAATSFVVANAASVSVFHRDIVDFVVSAVTDEDCSIVHIDRNQRYCRPPDPPSAPPLYCTRTIGVPNCWASPTLFRDPPPGLAGGPWALTPQQEADRNSPFSPFW